jgi:hypothetical protein
VSVRVITTALLSSWATVIVALDPFTHDALYVEVPATRVSTPHTRAVFVSHSLIVAGSATLGVTGLLAHAMVFQARRMTVRRFTVT